MPILFYFIQLYSRPAYWFSSFSITPHIESTYELNVNILLGNCIPYNQHAYKIIVILKHIIGHPVVVFTFRWYWPRIETGMNHSCPYFIFASILPTAIFGPCSVITCVSFSSPARRCLWADLWSNWSLEIARLGILIQRKNCWQIRK